MLNVMYLGGSHPMKQKGEQGNGLFALFNDEELEVAEILCQFPELVIQYEYGDCFPTWGCKRMRSATLPTTSCSGDELPINVDTPFLETSPTPSCSSNVDTRSLEPDTHPLHPQIKTKDEDQLLKLVEDLTKCKADLQKAIGNVESYYARLKDFNTKLRDRKAEYCSRTEKQCEE